MPAGAGRAGTTAGRRPICAGSMTDQPICPLCHRPIPPHAKASLHHLVPKLKGGRNGPTALMHAICHNEIHAALTEAELARDYRTVEALRTHPRLARFIEWVQGRDPAFHSRTARTKRRLRR